MKAKVMVEKIRCNYAEGWVYTDALTEEQQIQLGVDITADYADLVEVEIDFTPKYAFMMGSDDNRIEVTDVRAFKDGNSVDITNIVRIDELEMDIEEEYL